MVLVNEAAELALKTLETKTELYKHYLYVSIHGCEGHYHSPSFHLQCTEG